MSYTINTCKFWSYDDITECTKYNLQLYPPAVIGVVSISILLSKSILSYAKSFRNSGKYSQEESKPLLGNINDYGSATQDSEVSQSTAKSLHFDLAKLSNTNEDGTPHGKVELVYKSASERIRVSIEYLLVILSLALHLLPFFLSVIAHEFKHSPYVPLVQSGLWSYLFLICTIRIINIRKVSIRLPSLWIHSTSIYFFNFFPSLFTFRSALVHPGVKSQVRQYYIIEFVINAVLLYLNFTAKVGDKPSHLYHTPGVEPSPENVSSIASFISYSWIDRMVWKAHKSPLKNDDIWGLREDDYSLYVLKGFEASKSTLRFTYKLFAHFKVLFAVQGFWAVLESILIFGPSLLLKKVLEYVADPSSSPRNLAWTFVLLMPVVKMSDTISSGCSLFLGRRVCCRMKAIIIGQVYAKALRRKITVTETIENNETEPKIESEVSSKKESKKTAELGAIINLMAIDAFKVSEVCGYLHFFVSAILMILICTGLLYSLIGWSALVGSLGIFALLPVSFSLSHWLGRIQKQMLNVTDARIQKLNETFQSIRIVKFFAWEDKFFENVMGIRSEELYYLKLRCAVWCASAFIWFITPTLVTLLSFYCYTVIEGKPLTAPLAFTSLSLFTLLRSPLDQLADMTSLVIQSKVSLDRISDFLDEPETSKYDQLTQNSGDPNAPTIGFQNAILSWNSQSATDFKLRDLNIDFKIGKLNVIIGPTGAGKTSLLLGLLGEMDLISGNIYLPGLTPRDDLVVDRVTGLTDSIAYCSQSPWLLNDTIKNNICFGTPYIKDRYDAVVEACSLTRDFQILSAGDATEIGEKGITLSGGQKQRVSLARALYSNSKHLLLDDCLSAVDSHTALWIYENCISGPLMHGRTCILVSHNVALTVQKADWVVVLENGRVKNQGTAEELLDTGDLGDDDLVKSSVLSSREQSSTNLKSLQDKNTEMKAKADAIDSKLKAIKSEQEQEQEEQNKTDGKLVEDESKAEGVVGSEVYLAYAKYFGGWSTWTLVVLAFVISQGVFIYQTFWLRKWSSESSPVEELTMSASQVQQPYVVHALINPVVGVFHAVNAYKEAHSTLYYISVYAVIGFGYGFASCFRLYVTFFAGVRASNKIFESVLKTILRAKLRFFDKTPLGRIMNRFSKDIEAVDQELTPFAEGVFMCLVQCASTLVLITFITPGFLIFALVIAFLYYLVGYFYLTLSRELKRYESITKSPIHQHFSESLNGVATIRAYGIESRFMKQNLKAIDTNNRPFFYLWVANRWLAFRIDAVGSMVMLFSGIFVLLSIGKIDSGLAGLSLTYAIAFSESALWVVRLYATVEMNMNSMERLQEFLEVEQEPPYEIKETEPRPSWPEHGRISVKDVSLRYAPELPRVIKNVTFDVEPCNKVGIVGRTGAGKSTIITAFFRFLDPETGSITIDGVDITTIGLRNLRQAITIIPQDPTLFSGTIRSNLDPFEQYTDVQIFEALRRVNLISSNEELRPGSSSSSDENQNKFYNLDNTITEGGGNLSQGERQLICLARSLLKNPKVILLDEATSSIDYKSDAMIQQTVREEFGASTILTIAHRLRTIIDYDKILVMDAGKVVEYENPYVLLTDQTSLFYSMCENSGELESLIRLAKEAYIKNKNALVKK